MKGTCVSCLIPSVGTFGCQQNLKEAAIDQEETGLFLRLVSAGCVSTRADDEAERSVCS